MSFVPGDDHLAEARFDQGGQGGSAGLEAALPLRFNW